MLLTILLCAGASLGFGVFMGLPSLIPLFRRVGREDPAFRRSFTRSLAILTIILFYVTGSVTLGTTYIRSVNCNYSAVEDTTICEQIDIPGGDTEAVLRSLLPPFLRDACITGNTDLCNTIRAEDVFENASQWTDYIALLTGSLLSGGVCWFFVHHRLRPR
jgi:hypothetical protein